MRNRTMSPADIPTIDALIQSVRVSKKAKSRLKKIRNRILSGTEWGTDWVYFRAVLMTLYASSERMEELIFAIRCEIITKNGNFAKAAESLKMKLSDLMAIVDEHPRIFKDLTSGNCTPSTTLFEDLKIQKEMSSALRAVRMTKGNISLAANILGTKRSTLSEKLRRFLERQDLNAGDEATRD